MIYECIDFLGNRRSAVLRRIFCAVKSVSSAALLGVMQGRDTKPGAKETSKTVLRKFPRKSNEFLNGNCIFKLKVGIYIYFQNLIVCFR